MGHKTSRGLSWAIPATSENKSCYVRWDETDPAHAVVEMDGVETVLPLGTENVTISLLNEKVMEFARR